MYSMLPNRTLKNRKINYTLKTILTITVFYHNKKISKLLFPPQERMNSEVIKAPEFPGS